jgi:peptidyl-prolyl cis-trans isomerase A (cyclophilin A)
MMNRIALTLVLLSFAIACRTSNVASSQTATVPAGSQAILHTSAGDMKCTLFPDKAPKAAANFVGLARGTKDWKDPLTGQTIHGKPLFDGVIFHRVIPGFMIQGGDPSGTGSGDVGFKFEDELHADLLFDQPGRLAMANAGRNTNSSQFFITEREQPGLNPCLDDGGCQRPYGHVPQNSGYTIFGQCDAATVELVKKIALMPRGPNDRPMDPVKIIHVEIVEGAAPANVPPAAGTPTPKPSPKSTR